MIVFDKGCEKSLFKMATENLSFLNGLLYLKGCHFRSKKIEIFKSHVVTGADMNFGKLF